MATTFIVIKVPGEDYYERTGSYTVAVELAERHGGHRTGGGTCLITGMSDIDVKVPTSRLAGLITALDDAGLSYQSFDESD